MEYLCAKVAETIRKDLNHELDFVAIHEASLSAVHDIIDVPDRRASLFVRLYLQNDGRLGKAKRDLLREVTDGELAVFVAERDADHPGRA